MAMISGQLVTAFRQATPSERVFFSLPKPGVAYSDDRTAGSLFLRGRYLHVVLQDHSSFIQADTGGGETKDIRDTKGMKLWVAGPAQAAQSDSIRTLQPSSMPVLRFNGTRKARRRVANLSGIQRNTC